MQQRRYKAFTSRAYDRTMRDMVSKGKSKEQAKAAARKAYAIAVAEWQKGKDA